MQRTKEQKEPSDQTAAEKKRLIQIKGRRNVFVREVRLSAFTINYCTHSNNLHHQVELTPLSMNSGDVFILDIGTKIYQVRGIVICCPILW